MRVKTPLSCLDTAATREPRERCAFSGAVHTHQCLEEESLGQLLCLRTQRTYGQGPFEGGPNAGFRVSSARLRRLDDRAVGPSQRTSTRVGAVSVRPKVGVTPVP